MASIIKTDEQKTALKDINADIRTVASLNEILKEAHEGECVITVAFGKQRASISTDVKTGEDILSDKRKRLVSEIRSKARKYSISLDESDIGILENKSDEPEQTAEAESETEVEAEPAAENSDDADEEDTDLKPGSDEAYGFGYKDRDDSYGIFGND